MDFHYLENIAIKAAIAAGQVIQEHMTNHVLVERKEGGASYASQVVTKVDRACEAAILSHLKPTCEKMDIALLSEETDDDGSRFEKDFFWCIDPMDGTLAFINKRPGFSVSIALVRKDGVPFIGVVYDPSSETMYHAVRGHGVYKNKERWDLSPKNRHLSYITDRTLNDTPHADSIEILLTQKVERLHLEGVEEIHGAGSVLNAIRVLENGPALMMKLPKKELGGGSVWDFAATACIYHEFGLRATDFEGKMLDLNRKDGTFMNHKGIYYSNL